MAAGLQVTLEVQVERHGVLDGIGGILPITPQLQFFGVRVAVIIRVGIDDENYLETMENAGFLGSQVVDA